MRSVLIVLCFTLSACASLPRSGPSIDDVVTEAAPSEDGVAPPFMLVDLTPEVAETLRGIAPIPPTRIPRDEPARQGEILASGDRIVVTLFEATSGGLFGQGALDEGGPMRTLPAQTIDPRGRIRIPFAGEVAVAGLDPGSAAQRIEAALRGQAIEPQAMVVLAASPTSAVTVLGDAVTGGARVPLTGTGERLLDVIAAAGGFSKPLHESVVRLTRGGAAFDVRGDDLLADPSSNVRIHPSDVIAVSHKPRTYVILGAVGKPAQMPFGQSRLHLAEALARGNGLADERATPEGVFLIRRERPEILAALGESHPPETPAVVYRIDLTRPSGFLAAQRFDIAEGDILFVANADSTPVERVLRMVSLALAPLNTGIILTNVLGN